jgi:hypothetical protein
MKWIKSITAPGKKYLPSLSATLPADGLAIAGGIQRSYSTGNALFIMRLDSLGDPIWSDSIVESNGSTLRLTGMSATPDGEIIIVGEYTNTIQCSGASYTAPNSTGRCTYIARFKNGSPATLTSITNAGDPDISVDGMGNILLAVQLTGNASGLGSNWTPNGAQDVLISKISPANTLLWSKQISGNTIPGRLFYEPSGQIIYFGSFVDTLFFDNFHYPALGYGAWGTDQYMLVLNNAGNIINKHISTTNVIRPTQVLFFGNEFIMAAPSPWNHGMDVALQKSDTSATSLWYKSLSGGYAEGISMHHIGATDNNSFWAIGPDAWYIDYGIGTAQTDLILQHYNLNGTLMSSDSFNLAMDNNFSANASTSSTPGNLFYCGMFRDSVNIYGHSVQGNGEQMFVFRMSSYSTVDISEAQPLSFRLFPNPTSGRINILADQSLQSAVIRIYDIQGKTVFERRNELNNGASSLQVDLESGLYMLQITNENQTIDHKQKFVISK